MRILVTGAGGFIGSHLCEHLIEKGHDVRAFVRYNSQNSWGWLEYSAAKKQIEVYTGDIRDYDSVLAACKGVECIFHLAALIGIPYSYRSPLAYIKTNAEGTYNVCQAAREAGARVIQISTSEVYGTACYVPIDENHPLQAQSPYAATKIAADQLALSYHRSFRLSVVVVRPFNTFGPRQSARAIIPTIITQILAGYRQLSLGNLHPTRDLTFVEDTVEGMIAAGLCPEATGEVINLGTGREISIGDLALLIIKLMRADILIKQEENRTRPKTSEVERLLSDTTKVKQLTNWSPQYTLEEGLQKTIDWIKENIHIYKADLYNI